jgi:hypothetical protein
VRAELQNKFAFYEIKEIIGLTGFDLNHLAYLEQKSGTI